MIEVNFLPQNTQCGSKYRTIITRIHLNPRHFNVQFSKSKKPRDMLGLFNTGHRGYLCIQWGSEYRTSLVFEWSKVVQLPNGPAVFECHLNNEHLNTQIKVCYSDYSFIQIPTLFGPVIKEWQKTGPMSCIWKVHDLNSFRSLCRAGTSDKSQSEVKIK